jgi:flagellar FliL protein
MAAKPKKSDVESNKNAIEDDEEDAATPVKRKIPLKLIIIAAAGLLVLGGGGFGAYKLFFSHSKNQKTEETAKKPAVFVDLPDVLVNLSSSGSDRTQYLKVKIVLEVSDQALVQQIQPLTPRLMDTFQTYLRELRATDLDGSAGLYRLKEELTRRVNVAVAPSKITAVLFKEIVVQ